MSTEIARLACSAGTLSAAANRCCWKARLAPSATDAAHSSAKLATTIAPATAAAAASRGAPNERAAPPEALHRERRRHGGEGETDDHQRQWQRGELR
jgi:hypothetical protein